MRSPHPNLPSPLLRNAISFFAFKVSCNHYKINGIWVSSTKSNGTLVSYILRTKKRWPILSGTICRKFQTLDRKWEQKPYSRFLSKGTHRRILFSLVFWNGREREVNADRITFPKGFKQALVKIPKQVSTIKANC